MGRLTTRLVEQEPDFEVHALVGSSDPIERIDRADLVVDLTIPSVSASVVDAALERGIPVLVGTSGWSADRIDALRAKLRTLPEAAVVIVPNFSLGSAVAIASFLLGL